MRKFPLNQEVFKKEKQKANDKHLTHSLTYQNKTDE